MCYVLFTNAFVTYLCICSIIYSLLFHVFMYTLVFRCYLILDLSIRAIHLLLYLFVELFIDASIDLLMCSSMYLSIYLSIRLFICYFL